MPWFGITPPTQDMYDQAQVGEKKKRRADVHVETVIELATEHYKDLGERIANAVTRKMAPLIEYWKPKPHHITEFSARYKITFQIELNPTSPAVFNDIGRLHAKLFNVSNRNKEVRGPWPAYHGVIVEFELDKWPGEKWIDLMKRKIEDIVNA